MASKEITVKTCTTPTNPYNYNSLSNKPTINGVTLQGSLTTEDLNIEYEDIQNPPEIGTGTLTLLNDDNEVLGQFNANSPEDISFSIGPIGHGAVKDVKVNGESVVTEQVANIDLTTKQDKLESGVSIKTINDESLLGEGNITIATPAEVEDFKSKLDLKADEIDLVNHAQNENIHVTSDQKKAWDNKQDALVSGGNIKTINNQTIMGSGNLTVTASTTFGEINGDPEDNGNLKRALDTKANAADVYKKDEVFTTAQTKLYVLQQGYQTAEDVKHLINDEVEEKQDILVSGQNIKTINGQSLLGSGDITIQSGTSGLDVNKVNEHLANTDIHVTTTDKANWNNKLDRSDLEPYATKEALNDKANAVDVYGKSEVYTKTELDAIIPNRINRITYNKEEVKHLLSDLDEKKLSKEDFVSTLTNNLKTINNQSLVGTGNITIEGGGTGGTSSFAGLEGEPTDNTKLKAALDAKQDTLVSGNNIKTINGQSLLGEGNIEISGGGSATEVTWGDITGEIADNATLQGALDAKLDAEDIADLATKEELEAKQDKLVAGANITIDPETNTISASGSLTEVTWGGITGEITAQTDLQSALDAKANVADVYNKVDVYSKNEIDAKNFITMVDVEEKGYQTASDVGTLIAQNKLSAGTGIEITEQNVINNTITNVSQLTNDSGYLVQSNLQNYVTNDALEDTLGDYVNSDKLTTTLNSYATKELVNTKANVADVYTKQEVNDAIENSTRDSVKYTVDNNIETKNHVVVPFGSGFFGSSPDNGWTNLAAVKGYNLETEEEVIQSEIGSATLHTAINSKDRPSIDTQEGQYKLAYEEEVALKADADSVYTKDQVDEKLRHYVDIPFRTGLNKVHTNEEIFGWFHVEDLPSLKTLAANTDLLWIRYGISLSTEQYRYRFPLEYLQVGNDSIKVIFEGLNTNNDVVSKYIININLNEVPFEESTSNLKVEITSLETPALTGGTNITIGEGNTINAPTNVSAFTNDSGYQTASQVSSAIASAVGDITGFEYQVVEELPPTGEKGIIYLVSNTHGEQDIYDEYIWVNNAFEKIGTTELDLSSYATQEWVEGKGYAVKTTVDSQIAEVDNKFANYRTITEQIEVDNTKANVADVYNKTEVDGKLDTKANVEDVYTKEIIDKRSEVIISGPTTFNGWGSKVYPCFTGQTPLFWLANGTAGGRGLQDVAELKYYINNLNQFYIKQGISYSQGTYIYKFHVEYVQLEENTLHLVYTGLDMNASAEDKFCKYVLDIHVDDTVFEGTKSNVKAEKFAIEDFLDVQTELTAGTNITIQDGTISANVPTNVSAFTNDAAYQNKTQVDAAINASIANIATVKFTVVDELPQSGESDTIYLLKTTSEPAIQTFALSDSVESYLQYIWDALNTKFQPIGTTDISLAGYATETYVDNRVSEAVADITQFDVVIPEDGQLPLQGVKGTIYLVPSESGDGFYDEYLWVQDSFTKIGTTSIDFSDYVTHEELNTQLANKADKTQINAINAELALKANTSDLANYATTTALEAKQDKLIAGSNIRINDNVISATGEILNEVDFANITGNIASNPQLQAEFDKKVNEDDLVEITSEQVDDIWNEVLSA